jgi:PknH-like extracellular domain
MTRRISAAVLAFGTSVGCVSAALTGPVATARPSDPGVVSYAVLGKGSVGNIVGGPMRDESLFNQPFQGFFVDNPACNNWADIGLPEVYNDPDLASFNGASTQTSPTDQTHFVKQAVGVFATGSAAGAAFHRVVDRTVGCSGQTTAMHLDNGTMQVWSFDGGPAAAADASWSKQEAGTDRRCFTQTRLRENVLLQAKVCQSGNGGPAVNVLAGAIQNALGQ